MAARFVVVALMLLGACACKQQGAASGASGTGGRAVEEVVIAGEKFRLEVAADEASRRQGLMGRDRMEPGTGMIFIFEAPEVQSFWMGHCVMDIDILFLDARGRITAAHAMKAEAPKRPEESDAQYRARMADYWSNFPAQFAIEIPPGDIARLGLKVEQKIELDVKRLAALAQQ